MRCAAWGIENRLQWRLDVVFNEEASRIRKGNAPAILTSIRHLSMNRRLQLRIYMRSPWS
jgi:predicted transposase YbfD/YdcC